MMIEIRVTRYAGGGEQVHPAASRLSGKDSIEHGTYHAGAGAAEQTARED